MENEGITAISPVLPSSVSQAARRPHLSSSLPALPKKNQGGQYESKEEMGTFEPGQKIADYMSQEGPNWGSSSIGRHLKKFTSEQRLERSVDSGSGDGGSGGDRTPTSKRRRASSADITVHDFSKDPDSPMGSKQKRHRRTAAEIDRGFKCTVSNCHKAYGTEGALKMHLRIKHPSLNISSSSSSVPSRSSSMLINTNALQPLAVPSTPSNYPMDSPGYEHSPGSVPFSPLVNHPSRLTTPSPISPTALSIKTDPFTPAENSRSTTPHSPLVPSISPNTPNTPQTPAYPASRDARTHSSNWTAVTAYSDQIKYSNVPVLIIRIGNWKKGTLFHGDIIAKFMYEERKFVWEVYAVTTAVATFFVRIELNFDDIIGIGFETHQEIAVLTLDFRGPPTFYQAEIVPHQPVSWHPLAIDVTGGDIFTLRRHVLQFGKDAVIQPLQHLLKLEPRLHHLYTTSLTNMFQPSNMHPAAIPTTVTSPPFSTNTHTYDHDNVNMHFNTMPDNSMFSNTMNILHDSRPISSHIPPLPVHSAPPQHNPRNRIHNSDSSEEEGDDEEEEDMEQERAEPDHARVGEKDKGSSRGPPLTIIPPNPIPHSFHHTANTTPIQSHTPNSFVNQNYFNAIPSLELDPKESKYSTGGSSSDQTTSRSYYSHSAQPVPRYSVVVPGGMQPCACGGNYVACVCLKGLGPCAAMCICARYACDQLGDGAASVPPTPVLGSFPCDITF